MSSTIPHSTFEVDDRLDHIEVRGFSSSEVQEALTLLSTIREVQADQLAETRESLVHALMTHSVSLTPPASLLQAQRLASHRDALLASPVFTYATLRELRGDAKESSTRTWFARRRINHEVFSVTHSGRTLIPAFQFDEVGDPRPELKPVLSRLLDAHIDGWTLWTWLTTATSLLSGQVPQEVARDSPKRAATAAKRFATRPAA